MFEAVLKNTPVLRYKHLTGDFATASALALSIACDVIKNKVIPPHLLKAKGSNAFSVKKILIFNSFKGAQHSLMLVEKV